MAKANNKLKIIYLMRLFLDKTDETHYITMEDILKELLEHGIKAERKSIYTDIEALKKFGFDIKGFKGQGKYNYHLVKRDFELAELKLLVDLVKASKFITVRKSDTLIKKISSLTSEYEAKELSRHVHISKHVKAFNEDIYYNVDQLHKAFSKNNKIKFNYCQWNLDKKLEAKKNGDLYEVSPWALVWDNENYYMVAFDPQANIIKHYRVDKMLNIELVAKKREGRKEFKEIELAKYPKSVFGMYGGDKEKVSLECSNDLVGVIIDRFGKDIEIDKVSDEEFRVDVEVQVSRMFLAWIIGLGDGVKVLGPEFVVEMIREEGKRLVERYE